MNKTSQEAKPIYWDEIRITSYSAAITCTVIIFLVFVSKDWHNALACVPGALLGWLMGVLLSPYADEKALFSGYAKSAAAFATGFLVSKVDRVFELFMAKNTTDHPPLILIETVWQPFIFGFSSLLLVLIYTFTCRHYGQRAAAEDAAAKLATADASAKAAAP